MARGPINADVPAAGSGEAGTPRTGAVPPGAAKPATAKSKAAKTPGAAAPPGRRRRPIPAALKGIAALFGLAAVFLVAAILGGGSNGESSSETPAPVIVDAPAQTGAADAEPTAELGYPTFATSNTTRVGGPDPASNAAGVALATYPSAAEAQRPPAVALVDAGSWQAGIAAAVLMAEPLGAPILIAADDDIPEPTSQALDTLEPRGSRESGGVQAFAIGSATPPAELETRRVGAGGPAATAATIARLRDRLFGGPPRHIVVAPLAEPGLAMPAAAWAARSGDPVLFSGARKLPTATARALRRHPRVPVYVLGPSSAIGSAVVRRIGSIADEVRRVSGEDPVANAIAFARYDDGDFGWNVNDPGHGFVVARSNAPLDAAAAAPLSASGTWGPLLLSDSADTLPRALRGYLLDVKPGYTTDPTRAFYNHVWVIGDEDAIDVSLQAEIDDLAELARIGSAP